MRFCSACAPNTSRSPPPKRCSSINWPNTPGSPAALALQDLCFNREIPYCADDAKLALYMRYQTTHERAFHKSLHALLKLRAEKRKTEIKFDSQKREEAAESLRQAAESRKQAAEIRNQEMHETRVRTINSQTEEREIDNEIRQTVEAPLPGNMRIPFDTLKGVFELAVHEVNHRLTGAAKAA